MHEMHSSTSPVIGTVWIVDDSPEFISILGAFLEKAGFEVRSFSEGEALLLEVSRQAKICSEHPSESPQEAFKGLPDLIFTDVSMPGLGGLELTQRLAADFPWIPVILVTAHASVPAAVDAMKVGAFNYISKPIHFNEIKLAAERALEVGRLKRENASLRSLVEASDTVGTIIGKTPAMQNLFQMISKLSSISSTVMILGESGTGKELVARAIHGTSARRGRPFIAINCAAIPEQLLESELFGHAKGSFTGAFSEKKGLFQEAKGGTVFLDEIGDMPFALQSKLLRVLQERKIRAIGRNHLEDVDVRVISATHKNLRQLIKEGKFREDLYYRLSVIPITVPALRERTDDIPLLIESFLTRLALRSRLPKKTVSPEAMRFLMRHPWKGNVRELENIVERATILCDDRELPLAVFNKIVDPPLRESRGVVFDFDSLIRLDLLEKRYVNYVLAKFNRNFGKAAEVLGVGRRTLYRWEQANDSLKRMEVLVKPPVCSRFESKEKVADEESVSATIVGS